MNAPGRPIRKFRGHTGSINCVKFNAECTCVITGSYDATVRIWDCRAQDTNALQTLNEAKDSVPSIDLSENEILTGSVDGHVRNYDIRMGQLRTDYVGHPVTSACFSNDNACILVSTLDNTIRYRVRVVALHCVCVHATTSGCLTRRTASYSRSTPDTRMPTTR